MFAADGVTPLAVDNPVLEMRRDRVSTSQFLAHLDTSGTSNGLITIVKTGSWVLSMTADQTSVLPSGRGFWDCFGKVNGALTPIASGVVVIRPRVTGDTGSPIPPVEPPEPPVEVVDEPTVIDISFPAGDDYRLDLTLAEDGVPMDLTNAVVDAYVSTTGGYQRLTDFAVTHTANVLHLSLTDTQTAALPRSCEWKCKLTFGTDTNTIAKGTVTVT